MSNYHDPRPPEEYILQIIIDEFEYNHVNGELVRYYKTKDEYRVVGTDSGAALVTSVAKRNLYVHHICWFLFYKKWPTKLIDHKDTNYKNNSIINLRESNTSVNQSNKFKTSGLPIGVHLRKDRVTKRFQAQIMVQYKKRHLGYFDTPEEAHIAYRIEYKSIYGIDYDE
jgi:hypothetical protein